MKTTDAAVTGHQIVSPENWTAARKELLRKEKELIKTPSRADARVALFGTNAPPNRS